jgi:hypothetical protein
MTDICQTTNIYVKPDMSYFMEHGIPNFLIENKNIILDIDPKNRDECIIWLRLYIARMKHYLEKEFDLETALDIAFLEASVDLDYELDSGGTGKKPNSSNEYYMEYFIRNRNKVQVKFEFELLYDPITNMIKISKLNSWVEISSLKIFTKKHIESFSFHYNELLESFRTVIRELMIETPPRPTYIPPPPVVTTPPPKSYCIIS